MKLALICLSINVVFCFVYLKKLNTPFRRLFYFLILNLITEILAFTFMQFEYNNLPLLHLYTLGEFVLFSYFYRNLIDKPVRLKNVFIYFVGMGCVLIVLNSVFLQSIYAFNTFAKTSVQVVIIAYAVLYFYNLVENRSLSSAESKSLRLVNSAVLIYYSGSLFIFMYGKFSLINVEGYVVFWAFNAILNFIFQLLILIGLWKAFFRKKTLSP
ncbi:MAG: hypothetical protein AAF489_05125 [Bacteroidota bacterium]